MKRYIRESGSADVAVWLRAGTAATARLSWVEIVSAATRRARSGDISPARLARIAAAIERDARRLLTIEFTDAVESKARHLLLAHPLRAADAIQLAGALDLAERSGRPIAFVVFDEPLAAAARSEGLKTLGA